jgi:hypothetical protein
MKAAGEEEFQNWNEEAISRFNLCDCLDLFRKVQFTSLPKSRAQKKLLVWLKARIISLVMPGDHRFSTSKLKHRNS